MYIYLENPIESKAGEEHMKNLNLIAVKLFQRITRNSKCMIGSIFVALSLAFLVNIVFNRTINASIQSFIPLILFGSVGGILFYFDFLERQRKAHLLIYGKKIAGFVIDVKKRRYTKIHTTITHFGNEDVISPYEIIYKYEVHGKKFVGKSDLIWDTPNIQKGDSIEVYLDIHKPQLSTIKY